MFTKNIDQLGRIVIPSDIRKKLGVDVGDALDLNLKNNTIIISKHYEDPLDELQGVIQKVQDPQLRCELWGVFDNYKKKVVQEDE
ncbi:MAG: AbrB/MazE/SpoVT family DNA-binding domain-containing protein [Ruminococcus sp.]|nr:AbrB/MazE/SpoVT family DNA-binding domain-containing protein [Ruminococcus sp.]